MDFRHFLRRLRSRNHTKIRHRLNALSSETSITLQMIENLYNDSRLRLTDWRDLVHKLSCARSGNDETTKVILDFCRDGRSLIGGAVRLGRHVILGRVVSQDKFCEALLDVGHFIDMADARAQIRLFLDVSPSALPRIWKEMPMGRHIMWATFDPDVPQHPFGNSLPKAKNILCVMGLKPGPLPILMLEYQLPDDVDPCFPTFCDAYAAEKGNWTRYFRPAIDGAPYGLTMPTDTCPDQKGCPEVVHKVVKMNTLVKPLRQAI